jgi:dipeptidyl-peptidase-4
LDTTLLRQYAATHGFVLGRPVKPQTTPDGAAVLFLRAEARSPGQSLYEFDVATKQTRELLAPAKLLGGAEEHLSPEEKARRERQRVSAGGFTDFQLSEDGRRVLVSLSGRLYVLERASGRVEELHTGPGPLLDPQFSPDNGRVAYVRDFDVHVYDLFERREARVTTGGTRGKTHGLAEFVAQEEMHRHSGYWWSPDGKAIAYEEADASGVEVWYVADPMEPGRPPEPQFYPRPGQKNVSVRLGVIPAAGGETVWVEWDRERYEYLAAVRWDRHGPLTLTVQTRRQSELALLRADPTTGETWSVRVERDPAWVNLYPDVPHWLSDGSEFLWVTEAGGGAQLVTCDTAGNAVRTLAGAPGFQTLLGVDDAHGRVAYQRSATTTVSANLIEVSPLNPRAEEAATPGQTQKLSQGFTRVRSKLGLNSAVFAKDFALAARTSTTLDSLPVTDVLGPDFTAVGELPSVAESPPFVPRVELLEAGGGPTYFAAVVRPRDFDLEKKYPVIVDVYGGPRRQRVLAAMRNWLLPQWLADQGFVVVALDGRGTPHRGRDWERAVHRAFGGVPLDDQIAGLQELGRKFPELDLSRVGIVGWSFGGYLSALAVLKRPDVFHAAVAGAPVCDWLDYDTHYTERYLGLPQDAREAYRAASLLAHADRLSRPLLIVHGTADDNVFFRHALKLIDALFRAGQDFEVLPLPGLTHMVHDPVFTERLWSRIARHFQKHLGSPS